MKTPVSTAPYDEEAASVTNAFAQPTAPTAEGVEEVGMSRAWAASRVTEDHYTTPTATCGRDNNAVHDRQAMREAAQHRLHASKLVRAHLEHHVENNPGASSDYVTWIATLHPENADVTIDARFLVPRNPWWTIYEDTKNHSNESPEIPRATAVPVPEESQNERQQKPQGTAQQPFLVFPSFNPVAMAIGLAVVLPTLVVILLLEVMAYVFCYLPGKLCYHATHVCFWFGVFQMLFLVFWVCDSLFLLASILVTEFVAIAAWVVGFVTGGRVWANYLHQLLRKLCHEIRIAFRKRGNLPSRRLVCGSCHSTTRVEHSDAASGAPVGKPSKGSRNSERLRNENETLKIQNQELKNELEQKKNKKRKSNKRSTKDNRDGTRKLKGHQSKVGKEARKTEAKIRNIKDDLKTERLKSQELKIELELEKSKELETTILATKIEARELAIQLERQRSKELKIANSTLQTKLGVLKGSLSDGKERLSEVCKESSKIKEELNTEREKSQDLEIQLSNKAQRVREQLSEICVAREQLFVLCEESSQIKKKLNKEREKAHDLEVANSKLHHMIARNRGLVYI